tara:strand:- start:159 stop:281 length:123 start_codon:yes stop_codon:yes gene_type:complete
LASGLIAKEMRHDDRLPRIAASLITDCEYHQPQSAHSPNN